jgi:hypothetical protein
MNFNLNKNKITFILNVLGELPSRTNAFVLLQNLQKQIDEQKFQAGE